MRVLAWLAGILGCILLAYYGGGSLLPDHASIYRKMEIGRPPSAVFSLINDLKTFDQWWLFTSTNPAQRPDQAGPATISGPPSGVGQKQIWLVRNASDRQLEILGQLEIVESEADRHVAIAVDVPDWLSGRFRFDLGGSGNTELEWATDVALDTTFKRWAGYFLADKAIGALEEISLVQLKELAETGTIRRPDLVKPAKTVSPPTAS
jgi:hypothetical protein